MDELKIFLYIFLWLAVCILLRYPFRKLSSYNTSLTIKDFDSTYQIISVQLYWKISGFMSFDIAVLDNGLYLKPSKSALNIIYIHHCKNLLIPWDDIIFSKKELFGAGRFIIKGKNTSILLSKKVTEKILNREKNV